VAWHLSRTLAWAALLTLGSGISSAQRSAYPTAGLVENQTANACEGLLRQSASTQSGPAKEDADVDKVTSSLDEALKKGGHAEFFRGTQRLQHMGSPAKAAVPVLVKALAKGGRFGSMAAVTLSTIGPDAKGAAPALICALDGEDPEARLLAIVALARIRPEPSAAAPALIKALGDKNARVRHAAALCLGELGIASDASVTALKKSLRDRVHGVRGAAAASLIRMGFPAQLRELSETERALGPKDFGFEYTPLLTREELKWLSFFVALAIAGILSACIFYCVKHKLVKRLAAWSMAITALGVVILGAHLAYGPQLDARLRHAKVIAGMSREEVEAILGGPPGDYGAGSYSYASDDPRVVGRHEVWAFPGGVVEVGFDDKDMATGKHFHPIGPLSRLGSLLESLR
jgi:HEAT repeats